MTSSSRSSIAPSPLRQQSPSPSTPTSHLSSLSSSHSKSHQNASSPVNRIFLIATPSSAKIHAKSLQSHLTKLKLPHTQSSPFSFSTIHLYEWNSALRAKLLELLGTEASTHFGTLGEAYVVLNAWKGTLVAFLSDIEEIVMNNFIGDGGGSRSNEGNGGIANLNGNAHSRERSGSGNERMRELVTGRSRRSSSVNSAGSSGDRASNGSSSSNRSSGGFAPVLVADPNTSSSGVSNINNSTNSTNPSALIPAAHAELLTLYKIQSDIFEVLPSKVFFPRHVISERVSTKITLTNRLDSSVAFKIKTTSPKGYCVSPKGMILQANQSQEVEITKMAGMDERSVCSTRFRIESTILNLSQRGVAGSDFQTIFSQQEVLSRQKLPCEVVSSLPDEFQMEKRDGMYFIEILGDRLRSPGNRTTISADSTLLGSTHVSSIHLDDLSTSQANEYNQKIFLELQRQNNKLREDNKLLKMDIANSRNKISSLQVDDVPSFVNAETLLGRKLSALSASELSQLHRTLQSSVKKVFEEYVEKTRGETDLCLMCLDEARSVLFLPCKHMVACGNCTSAMQDKHRQEHGNLGGGLKCPMCRQVIVDMVHGIHL
mmetsp:Transcript_10617/g.39590  ORF Transcript_10617/g.39590 Transcript_10617/m.39590 type:complete len:601 (+) Transcript_10617:1-1803(+)